MSLIEVKNQIQATKNTKKITKAMQLVAASKMKRFQKVAVNTRAYTNGLVQALHLTHRSIADSKFGTSNGEKTLFVLMTSDKGLCGAMNTRLLRLLFSGEEWNAIPEDQKDLITIGRKSTDAALYRGIKTIKSFTQIKEDLTPLDAIEIIDDILELWDGGEYAKVYLISPWYTNAFTFATRMNTMLPITTDLISEYAQHIEKSDQDIQERPDEGAGYFEPNRERAAESLSLKLAENLFLEAFYQLKATEYSSRMVAMKKATEAADDQIKALTAKFNKARQAAITQQLAELASANEAMSSLNAYEIYE